MQTETWKICMANPSPGGGSSPVCLLQLLIGVWKLFNKPRKGRREKNKKEI
jgi:hypothetical protein